MIVDSSAILAALFGENDSALFARSILAAAQRRVSVVNWLEVAVRVDGRGGYAAEGGLEDFLRATRIRVEPVTEEHGLIARSAYRRYGRGRHPAGLNLGDCFAYALAKAAGEPLLFKGEGLRLTDVTPAL